MINYSTQLYTIPAGTKTIGIFSDLHANMQAVFDVKSKHSEIKYWFCAGDMVDMFKPFYDNNPMLRMMVLEGIPSVTGNHEIAVKNRFLKDMEKTVSDYLQSLPFNIKIEFDRLIISIYHATPKNRNIVIPDDASRDYLFKTFNTNEADIFVFGHTHRVFQKEFDGVKFINPGALGVEDTKASYAIISHTGTVEIKYL